MYSLSHSAFGGTDFTGAHIPGCPGAQTGRMEVPLRSGLFKISRGLGRAGSHATPLSESPPLLLPPTYPQRARLSQRTNQKRSQAGAAVQRTNRRAAGAGLARACGSCRLPAAGKPRADSGVRAPASGDRGDPGGNSGGRAGPRARVCVPGPRRATPGPGQPVLRVGEGAGRAGPPPVPSPRPAPASRAGPGGHFRPRNGHRVTLARVPPRAGSCPARSPQIRAIVGFPAWGWGRTLFKMRVLRPRSPKWQLRCAGKTEVFIASSNELLWASP